MKEGWIYKKLGEVFRTYAGGTPSKTNKANYNNGTIPWIRSGEVCRKYITESELFISEEGLKNSSAKYYPINTVLVAMYGATAAQSGILKFEATSNQAVCGILPHKDFVPEFVYAFFTYIKDELASQAQGGAQPNISQEKIKKILFPCIPLSEQQRIVERLDSAFENIEKLKANAEKQLAEVRTLFQKSLAKAMEPKEGWEEKTMSEITEVKDGTHDSPKYVTEGIPFVTQKNITINGFDLINTKKITLEDHKKFYTRSNVEFGDIIIAMIGANRGMSCIVNTREIFSIKNVGLIKKTDNINMRFLLYYLHSPAANSYVLENSNGGAQEFIGLKGLRNFPIHFPSLAEQQRIVERLDSLSENVRKYEKIQRQIISECDALKQALLRKVFE